jgi:APA family basic amino acid/polyamine antiporter
VTCAFSALAFAELASTIPVSGSAYTYSYATLGELVAWIIGWDLILEYAVSVAAVAVGWGQYFNDLMDSLFGFTLPDSLANPPGEGGSFNLPAVFIVLAVTAVLCLGMRESARTNTIMVFIKLAVLALFLALGVTAFDSGNLTPFAPEGLDGVVTAASVIFFAYIGFDAISTSGEETKNPGRDLPIAIIGSLAIATLLYIAVSVVAVGGLPFDKLNGAEAPLATVLDEGAGFGWAANVISFGALVAITSVVLTILNGQTRIMFAMCRDGLMPRNFARVNPKTSTPIRITATFGILIALIAAFIPLTEIVKLVNIGTLFAFIVVNIGVIILRRTKPDLERGYRVPFVPVFPIIGVLLCAYLMKYLERDTWLRFVAWLAIGLVIYFAYGIRHSRLRRGETVNPEAELDSAS